MPRAYRLHREISARFASLFFDDTDCSVRLWHSAPHGRVLRVQC